MRKRPLGGRCDKAGANRIHQNVPRRAIQGFFAANDVIVKSFLPERGNPQPSCTRSRRALEIPHRREKIGGGAIANEQDMKMIGHEAVSMNAEAMPCAGIPQNNREFPCKFFTREKWTALVAADGHKITTCTEVRGQWKAVRFAARESVRHGVAILPQRAATRHVGPCLCRGGFMPPVLDFGGAKAGGRGKPAPTRRPF